MSKFSFASRSCCVLLDRSAFVSHFSLFVARSSHILVHSCHYFREEWDTIEPRSREEPNRNVTRTRGEWQILSQYIVAHSCRFPVTFFSIPVALASLSCLVRGTFVSHSCHSLLLPNIRVSRQESDTNVHSPPFVAHSSLYSWQWKPGITNA